jgi:hypothetical protein
VKEEPVSVDVKLKLAEAIPTVPVGPEEIVVSGTTVSIVHVRLAGEGSVNPEGLVARTWNVWDPFVKAEYALGDVQVLKADPSRLHAKVEPVIVAEKLKLAEVVLTEPEGPAVIVVSTLVLFTVTVTPVDVAVFEALSTARAVIVTDPSAVPAEFQLML